MRIHLRFIVVLCGIAFLASCPSGSSANDTSQVAPVITGIPGPMIWQHPPANWKIEDGGTLSITAGKQTDWFVSPMGDSRRDNSPRLLFTPAEDFVFSAKVTVAFQSQWDSGALVLYVSDSLWAKLCFEKTVEQRKAIVSVVTKDVSDDNNSIEFTSDSVYLKVAKAGPAIFFYASENGKSWRIIRAFSLGNSRDLRIGFSSQSPLGDGCATVFSEISYQAKRVDLWQGQ